MDTKQKRTRTSVFDALLRRVELVPASDRFLLRILFFVIIGGLIMSVFAFNDSYSSVTATRGGTITEGVLGTPRFVNPVLANTRADQDVTALIYSGLLKIDTDGALVPDLASSITVAEDGLTYNIVLRDDIAFHDGELFSAKDVIFTIQLAQDADLKSPIRGNWSGVTIEEIGSHELNIVLEEPYAPFIENFTLGIMPAHLWSSLPIEQLPFSQLNTEPIGTGPFMLKNARRDQSGIITSYELSAFENDEDAPNIQTFEFVFFDQESELITALNEETIDATAYISNENLSLISDEYDLHTRTLPRVFGIFFNQNRSTVLRDDAAREALSVALQREEIIDEVLNGYGVPIDSPIASLQNELESEQDNLSLSSTTIEQATTILEDGNWEQNELGFWEKEIDDADVTLSVTLRTSNTPLFESTLNQVAEHWRELGVEVVTEQFEQTGLVQSVIRPRDFQALLFGLDMSRSYDLYPFWHSSQKDDPGLNIAQYTNLSVDALLEEARITASTEERDQLFNEASDIISEEQPAVLLFQPEFIYVVSDEVTTSLPDRIGKPTDRFDNTAAWHTRSDVLWPTFQDNI